MSPMFGTDLPWRGKQNQRQDDTREKEGEQAHSPGRVKRNFNSFYDPGVWKGDDIEDIWIGKTGEKGGREAANVAMLLLCQVCSTLWKTRTCPLSTQSSVQLPCGAAAT